MTRILKTLLLVSLLVILLAGFTAALYYSVTSRIPFGTDSYVFWLAAQEVVLERGNPYSESVTDAAQLAVYGREARPGENYMMFVNPPFSLFPFLPAAFWSYSWAQAYWIAFSILLLMVGVWAAYPRTSRWLVATLPFFYPAARGIIMGQFSPSIAVVLLVVYALEVDRSHLSPKGSLFAGLALTWATIKPQLTWLFILFFLVHAVKGRRWNFILGFGIGLGVLLALSWALVPNWPAAWFQQAVAHADNRVLQPGIVLWAGWMSAEIWTRWAALGLMILLTFGTGALFVQWWRGGREILPVFAATALLTLVLHPLYFPPALIVLLLPILAWAAREEVRGSNLLKLTWIGALLLPWMIFTLTFDGAEPYSISIWTPVLYLVWAFLILRRTDWGKGAEEINVQARIFLPD